MARELDDGARSIRHACGTIKAARCLLEALRAGADVEVGRRGRTWVVRRPGDETPLVRRRTKANAEEAIRAARELLQTSAQTCAPCAASAEPCTPDLPGTLDERRQTQVITPQRPKGEPAHYAIVSARALVASHDPLSFTPDPRYPEGVQERQYQSDVNEQKKVVLGAQNLEPALVLHRAPTPADGPPLITEDGIVLGGNGRSMMLKRAYTLDLPSAARYQAGLLEQARAFGFSQEDLAPIVQPILVRIVDGFTRSTPVPELVSAVRRYNESLTNALDYRALAVAQARQLSAATVEAIGAQLLERNESLRELLRSSPATFRERLEADKVLTAQNRSEWVTDAGDLTDRAKDTIEGMFLGKVLGEASRITATSPALLQKVERAIPHLVAVAGANPAFDLIPTMQEALDLLNDAARRRMTLEQLLSQGVMFGGSPRALATAQFLERATQREVGETFSKWARSASFNPRQTMMFGRPPTPDEVFAIIAKVEPPPMRKANVNDGRPPAAPAGAAAAGAPVLRVTLQQSSERAGGQLVYRPCLARVDPATSRVLSYEACGPEAKTSFETAVAQARTLARKMRLELDVSGLLEAPPASRRKNPGRPCFAPLVDSAAGTVAQLARELKARFPRPPRVFFVRMHGGLVRCSVGACGLLKATRDGVRLQELEQKLRAELRR